MKTYNDYNDIPSDVFQDTVEQLAFQSFAEVISLPGIYEILSEHFNNDVLELLCPEVQDNE